ncbi:hypothetical protein BJV78DRAFT_1155219 [Lactifluus subvellereus]|nr:hypothetical protein BJV78DRAFT_1155219 [Lactifluus subvellereus]
MCGGIEACGGLNGVQMVRCDRFSRSRSEAANILEFLLSGRGKVGDVTTWNWKDSESEMQNEPTEISPPHCLTPDVVWREQELEAASDSDQSVTASAMSSNCCLYITKAGLGMATAFTAHGTAGTVATTTISCHRRHGHDNTAITQSLQLLYSTVS